MKRYGIMIMCTYILLVEAQFFIFIYIFHFFA